MNEQKLKRGKPSWGAEVSAAYRAAASARPEKERVLYDPISRHFLGTILAIVVKVPLLSSIADWYAERLIPANIGYVIGRTAYIDDYLRTCIQDGIAQLVILGAGYDSRAYRFEELRSKVKVFEVDHPATQKTKIRRVKSALGSLPVHVVYVAIDFDKEKLDERMVQSGYDQNLKTLFIWEGVTMFIAAQGVDATLRFVARSSGEGSSIIFDYILKSVIDGTCDFEEAHIWRKVCERIGEPYTFGIELGSIGEFLAARRFHQVRDVGTDFIRSAYLEPRDPKRKVPRHYRVVHATVKRV